MTEVCSVKCVLYIATAVEGKIYKFEFSIIMYLSKKVYASTVLLIYIIYVSTFQKSDSKDNCKEAIHLIVVWCWEDHKNDP